MSVHERHGIFSISLVIVLYGRLDLNNKFVRALHQKTFDISYILPEGVLSSKNNFSVQADLSVCVDPLEDELMVSHLRQYFWVDCEFC